MDNIHFPIIIKLNSNVEVVIEYGENFNDYDYKIYECGLYLFGFNMDDVMKDKCELEKIIRFHKDHWGLI